MRTKHERFDHIDDHFMGRSHSKSYRIDEWQHMEEMSTEFLEGLDGNRKRKLERSAEPRPTKQQHKA